MELKVYRINKELDLPAYAHEGDAALDLRAAESLSLKPLEKRTVQTGIKLAIPKDCVGLIWDKSGIAARNGVHVLAGVIDSGYRGEIGIVLANFGKEEFKIEKNQKIAQMLIQPIHTAKIREVREEKELEETKRGEKGFGSTGLK